MSSKQEPFSGVCSEVLGVGPTSSTSVKLELDHSENGDEDDGKIEVKMEALDELTHLFEFGGHSIDMDSKEALIGSESLLMPLGPPPTYPGDLGSSSGASVTASLLVPSVKTVKVPLSSQMSDSVSSVFPPGAEHPMLCQPGLRQLLAELPRVGGEAGAPHRRVPSQGPGHHHPYIASTLFSLFVISKQENNLYCQRSVEMTFTKAIVS